MGPISAENSAGTNPNSLSIARAIALYFGGLLTLTGLTAVYEFLLEPLLFASSPETTQMRLEGIGLSVGIYAVALALPCLLLGRRKRDGRALHRSPNPAQDDAAEVPMVAGPAPRILVVDDEEQVRRAIQRLLERRGRRVITADSGLAALHVVAEDPDLIDLVLLDVVMPGLDGWTTLKELRRLDPEIRVLITSGSIGAGGETVALERGAVGVLPKPFSQEDLDRVLLQHRASRTVH